MLHCLLRTWHSVTEKLSKKAPGRRLHPSRMHLMVYPNPQFRRAGRQQSLQTGSQSCATGRRIHTV